MEAVTLLPAALRPPDTITRLNNCGHTGEPSIGCKKRANLLTYAPKTTKGQFKVYITSMEAAPRGKNKYYQGERKTQTKLIILGASMDHEG